MHGDLIAALFPLDARAGVSRCGSGVRAPTQGRPDFWFPRRSYMYILVCASFGIWLFFLRSAIARCMAAALMAISWPYFLLSGTRNIFLAVCLPFFIAYLLFGRQQLWFRFPCLAAAFLMLNTAFRVVISYRDIGFRGLLEGDERKQMIETTSMASGIEHDAGTLSRE